MGSGQSSRTGSSRDPSRESSSSSSGVPRNPTLKRHSDRIAKHCEYLDSTSRSSPSSDQQIRTDRTLSDNAVATSTNRKVAPPPPPPPQQQQILLHNSRESNSTTSPSSVALTSPGAIRMRNAPLIPVTSIGKAVAGSAPSRSGMSHPLRNYANPLDPRIAKQRDSFESGTLPQIAGGTATEKHLDSPLHCTEQSRPVDNCSHLNLSMNSPPGLLAQPRSASPQNPKQLQNAKFITHLPLPMRGQTEGDSRRVSGVSSHGSAHHTSRSLCDSLLSDITMSDVSATYTGLQSPNSLTNSNAHCAPPISGRSNSAYPAFGTDLEQQRQQAPLSIEEDLFIYDDIVISKDEARTKHWRLEGRKPGMPLDTSSAFSTNTTVVSAHNTISGSVQGYIHRRPNSSSGNGHNFFSFNDFDVCVDEMDLIPAVLDAGNSSSAASSTTLGKRASMLGANGIPLGGSNGNIVSGLGSGLTDGSNTGSRLSISTSHSIPSLPAISDPGSTVSPSVPTLPGGSTMGSTIALGSTSSAFPSCTYTVGSLSVTNTVPSVSNTGAALEQRQRIAEVEAIASSTCTRELRGFDYTTVLGHSTRVKCIALAPSERDYASCSNEDASIILSSLAVGDEVGIFTGHQDTVINASFSLDGKYLATTSKDKTMILWDVMTTKHLLTFRHAKVVICCCFSPDSKFLASGCQDRVCRVWDTRRGKEWVSHSNHEGIIISIAFSPDGNYICSASADKTLRVWSSTSAKTRFTLTGHVGIILSCSYTSDGKFIVSNDENLLRVWSTEDGSCTLSIAPATIAGVTHLSQRGPRLGWTLSSAAPGSFCKYIVVACNNRFVYVLDRETGEEVTSLFCKAPVYCLASGTYSMMACGDSFGNVYMLEMK